MTLAIRTLVLSAAAFAGPNTPASIGGKSKPQCAAAYAGKMWPDEANRDTKALRLATQSGDLELCSKHRDGYHWESVSVNVRQLRAAENVGVAGPLGNEYEPEPEAAASPAPDAAEDTAARATAVRSSHPRGFFQTIRRVLGIP